VSPDQATLPRDSISATTRPRGQVLKWVGNKFRYAEAIANYFPADFETYYEPFVGTGALLATLEPEQAVASDTLPMLIELHQAVQSDPAALATHYESNRERLITHGKDAYEEIQRRYNSKPNPFDLLVISRACYGGVMRFTRRGEISTPMGPHRPMPAEKLRDILEDWSQRLVGTRFFCKDFSDTMEQASSGDLVYCDPPYLHGQSIL
jgi:DNA adenine methylase